MTTLWQHKLARQFQSPVHSPNDHGPDCRKSGAIKGGSAAQAINPIQRKESPSHGEGKELRTTTPLQATWR